jgi:hypothetical protein
MNVTLGLLAYADDINIVGENMTQIQEHFTLTSKYCKILNNVMKEALQQTYSKIR